MLVLKVMPTASRCFLSRLILIQEQRSPRRKKDKADGRPTKRRKSVSFTSDTKTGDGDTATTLTEDQDRALIAAAKRAEDDSDQAIKNTNGPIANPPKGKSREEAKTAYLDYLSQFHNDKSNWKFNKAKQTDLLKNLFNIYRIPTEYNEALLAYIDGLQGLGAKQRLRAQASQLIEDIKESVASELPKNAKFIDMSTPEARKTAYAEAEQRELNRLEALGLLKPEAEKDVRETARRRQAQDDRAREVLLLRALTEELGLPSAEPTASHSENTQLPAPSSSPNGDDSLSARAKKRKRKARTADNDSDSESSSSSDSDSDSDSGKTNKAKTEVKKMKKTKVATTESSSSGSGSSSDPEESSSDSSSSDSDEEGDASSSSSSSEEEEQSKKKKKMTKEMKAPKQKAAKKTRVEVPFDKAFLDSAFGKKKGNSRW